MTNIDVLVDTDLVDRAVAAVDQFVEEHGARVERSQIAGLRQIANLEPEKISSLARHQEARAKKRLNPKRPDSKEHCEVAFWQLVVSLCSGKRDWSLEMEVNKLLPPAPPALEAGAKLTREEQAERKKAKRDLQEQRRQWQSVLYPAFFQHFCIHYSYRRATRADQLGRSNI